MDNLCVIKGDREGDNLVGMWPTEIERGASKICTARCCNAIPRHLRRSTRRFGRSHFFPHLHRQSVGAVKRLDETSTQRHISSKTAERSSGLELHWTVGTEPRHLISHSGVTWLCRLCVTETSENVPQPRFPHNEAYEVPLTFTALASYRLGR